MAILKHTTAGFSLGLAILVLVGAYSLRATSQFVAHQKEVAHTLEVQGDLKGLLISLLQAQTGRRGYALTGQERFLEPYRQAEATVGDRLRKLRDHTLDNPRQQERVDRLEALVGRRVGVLREAVALQQTRGRDPVMMAALTMAGSESMDPVRDLVAEMEREEDALLRVRASRAAAAAKRTETVIAAGTVVALSLVGFAAFTAQRERRRRDLAEAMRRELEIERNLLFQLSDDLIYIGAADSSFQRLNPAWERVLGHSREVLESRPALELVHPEDRESTEAAAAAIRGNGGAGAIENRLRGADGSYRWVQWSIRSDAGRGLTFAIGRDVTVQRQSSDEMRRARESAEAANRELEAFSYSVSHDLRAPLRHIDGFVDLLGKKAGGLDEPGRRYLGVISEAARKMGALIDDLLSFSRMGRADLRRTRVDLARILDEVLAEVRDQAVDRRIEWKVARLPEIEGDAAMLRLVLQNLVSNAVKYTRQRSPAHIEIGSSTRDERMVLFVRDDGAGFDMKYADKLFGVFQRLHRPEDFEGTGIGLATVQRIVLRHSGRVWAEGEPGRGATFYVSLPRNAGGGA